LHRSRKGNEGVSLEKSAHLSNLFQVIHSLFSLSLIFFLENLFSVRGIPILLIPLKKFGRLKALCCHRIAMLGKNLATRWQAVAHPGGKKPQILTAIPQDMQAISCQ